MNYDDWVEQFIEAHDDLDWSTDTAYFIDVLWRSDKSKTLNDLFTSTWKMFYIYEEELDCDIDHHRSVESIRQDIAVEIAEDIKDRMYERDQT